MPVATITEGSTVEVRSDEARAWYVGTLKFRAYDERTKMETILVKYDTLFGDDGSDKPLEEFVDPSSVRPLPPCEVMEEFEVCDVVDVYYRVGWWFGTVKKVIGEGEMRKYVVEFKDHTKEVEFERDNIRRHLEWVDGRWVVLANKTGDRDATPDAPSGFTTPSKGVRITDVDNETVSPASFATNISRLCKRSESNSAAVTCGKTLQSSAGSNGKTKVSGSDEIIQDPPPVERLTQTRESEDGKSHQKRKRGSPKLVVKNPTGLRQGNSYLGPLGRHAANALSQPIVPSASTTITDYQKDWPFTKRSPVWATIDTIDLYLTPPQKPHFSPLNKKKADYREGLAIAHMVTFGNLVQNLSGLQPSDPVDIINNNLETLCELETHGFEVGPIQSRLSKLLSLKSKMCEHEVKHEEVEKEIEKCNHERSLVGKEMDQLQVQMQVLKEKTAQTASMMKEKEGEHKRLQSNLHLVCNQINEMKLAFEELAARPL